MSFCSRSGVGAGVAVAGLAGYTYWSRKQPPIIVVGGGVMGLSTAECLARAGKKVVILDQNHPIRGSWGVTRACHYRMEDLTLLKMNLFAIPHWLELQKSYAKAHGGKDEDTLFFQKTGAMMAGPTDAIANLAEKVSSVMQGRPEGHLEVLAPKEALERFPQIRLDESERLFYMPHGYTMLVQTAMRCLHWAAEQSGAKYEEDPVVAIDRTKKIVTTESGKTYCYSSLVLTSGPWTNKMMAMAGLSGVPLVVSNEQTVEFIPKPGAPSYDWDKLPLFTWSEAGYKGVGKDGGCRYFYSTPHVPIESSGCAGVKVGFHRQGPLLNTEDYCVTDAGKVAKDKLPHIRKDLASEQQYELDEFALKQTQEFLQKTMPGLDPDNYVGYMRCLYQNTPDLQMMLGRHQEDASVFFACGFSGSGFQFAPAIAEYISTLVLGSKLNERHRDMQVKFDPTRFLN